MGSVNPSQLHRQNQNQPESPPLPVEFIEQTLVNLPPPWFEPRLPNSSSCDLNHQNPNSTASNTNINYDAAILASRLQQHQINGGDSPKPLLSVAQLDQIATQHFNQSPQTLGAATTGINQAPAAGNGKKVRARRGQATDPHSIAERLRRDKIAQRMKDLQQLLPIVNKTDKASMLDEIIEYVKFLQLQVKVLSMSRLGGAAAVAPLLADISTEEMVESIQTSRNGAQSSNGIQEASTPDNLVVMENQVSKLMEEDIGSAMQYLRGKGLCLMPIALASILSAATSSQARNLNNNVFLSSNLNGPTSPDLSVLSTQSTVGNGICETSVRDVNSTSNP